MPEAAAPIEAPTLELPAPSRSVEVTPQDAPEGEAAADTDGVPVVPPPIAAEDGASGHEPDEQALAADTILRAKLTQVGSTYLLIGELVELPLTGRRIPIVADEHADPEMGTGVVKITPAHDPTDFEIGERHDGARGGIDGRWRGPDGIARRAS